MKEFIFTCNSDPHTCTIRFCLDRTVKLVRTFSPYRPRDIHWICKARPEGLNVMVSGKYLHTNVDFAGSSLLGYRYFLEGKV